MKKLITFLIIFHCMLKLCAQPATLSADKNQILIGQPFQVRLSAVFSRGQKMNFTPLDSIAHFELQHSVIDTVNDQGRLTLTQTATYTSWDSGTWNILPRVADKHSRPLRITVSFSPLNPQQPYHDVKDIIEVPSPQKTEWYWYLIFLLLVAGLFLLFFPKEKKKPAKTEKPPPDEAIYPASLRALDQLMTQSQLSSIAYYTRLIDIFRDYLQKRKGIESHTQTTDDLMARIKDNNGLAALPDELDSTLQFSDMVKFAKMEAGPGLREQSTRIIRQSIINLETQK